MEHGNPYGVYMIILMEGNEYSAKQALEHLWKWKVLDAIVLVPSQNNSQHVDLYTWFPFQSEKECTTIQRVTLVDTYLPEGRFINNADLYPRKIKRNLHACPLVASTISWGYMVTPSNDSKFAFSDGLEVIIFKTIAETLNMTPTYIKPIPSTMVWGDYQPETGNYTGVIGDAKFGRSNLSFCGLPKNYFFELHVDSTHSYFESGFYWYVRCPRPRERWSVFIMTFSPSLWTALIATFITIAVIMRWIAEYSRRSITEVETYKNLPGCLQVLLAAFFNVSVSIMPITVELRILFSLWVWFSFSLTTVFQTFFMSYLVDPGTLKQVTTVDELLESSLTLTFDIGYYYLFEFGGERESKIISISKICDGFAVCSRRTATVGDTATVMDILNYDFYSHLYEEEFHDTLLCRLPERIEPYQVAMFMQKGNPLFESVNDIIVKLVESGIIDWWRGNVLSRQILARPKNPHEEEYIPYFVLSMKHMYVAFTVLGLGYFVSFCAFIIEYLIQFMQDCSSDSQLESYIVM
ncbi:hypothetical protein L9F63_019839 [Diploptera punctata]|uniref:Uncharacterized protein n=1 Tax=Diploptera punctata TaxID=6984 RepID=A0AAD8EDN8_DIPPU|nr:hypothetical protein L9F63_019839 [Diploptera punctata]